MAQKAKRLLRWLIPCCVFLAGCGERQREADVARVEGAAITQAEVREQLRGMLWRSGETWEILDEATRKTRRQEALDRCVEQALLEKFAKAPANIPATQVRESEEEFQQFLKQFEPPDGWKPRLEMQGSNEAQMRERITTEVVQGDAIEAWLKQQRQGGKDAVEAEARTWFEAHREQMRVPERARVSHIFLTGHDKEKPDRNADATEIHRKLTSGEATFEALAAKLSEDERSNKAGGNLGWLSRDRLPADFAEKVFALPLAKPSEPFRTKLGWHIVVVHEKRPSRLPEFAEVEDEVLAVLDSEWRNQAVKRLVSELRAKAEVTADEHVLRELQPGG